VTGTNPFDSPTPILDGSGMVGRRTDVKVRAQTIARALCCVCTRYVPAPCGTPTSTFAPGHEIHAEAMPVTKYLIITRFIFDSESRVHS
jgi:hypothetical protein